MLGILAAEPILCEELGFGKLTTEGTPVTQASTSKIAAATLRIIPAASSSPHSHPRPLTELVNQLLIAPTLAAFEEKVIACLPEEQEQKVAKVNN